MKKIMSIYANPEAFVRTKQLSVETSIPMGDLIQLFCERGLATIQIDQLKAWYTQQKTSDLTISSSPSLGRPRKFQTVDELRLLEAFRTLRDREGVPARYSLVDLARCAGVRTRTAYGALEKLQRQGLVEGTSPNWEDVDRHGFPKVAVWHLYSDEKDWSKKPTLQSGQAGQGLPIVEELIEESK